MQYLKNNSYIALILLFTLKACSHMSETIHSEDQRDEQFKQPDDFDEYTQLIPDYDYAIDMVPIHGGSLQLGDDNGTETEVAPFWMGKYEVTWDLYEMYLLSDEVGTVAEIFDLQFADAISMPSLPYIDPAGGMPRESNPVVNVTQYASLAFTRWLSIKTGHFYRLPTEAEWEYACKAGADSAYFFDENEEVLGEYAWYNENSNNRSHPVGSKQPNNFGLYDMLGNAAEWTLDQYISDYHSFVLENEETVNPWVQPTRLEPRTVRGGSWADTKENISCTSRISSDPESWKRDDPQIPQSLWWNTNAHFVGFRIVRPAEQPSQEEMELFWEQTLDQFYYE